MGSHSITCHPAEVTFLLLPQPKLVLEVYHGGVKTLLAEFSADSRNSAE